MRTQYTAPFGLSPRQASSFANPYAAQIGSTLVQQPAMFAKNIADVYGGYGNNMGSMFGSYGSALSNLGTAGANERSNLYGANAMMEAARMGALGNIGSAGLGAYGSAANAAQNAWAQNQNAYNQALAALMSSNQAAMSQLGQSRNNALGTVGTAAAQVGSSSQGSGSSRKDRSMSIGGKVAAAQAGGSGDFGFGGSGGAGGFGFTADSPSGPVANGSYSGGGIPGVGSGGSTLGTGMSAGSQEMNLSTSSSDASDFSGSQSQVGDRGLILRSLLGIQDDSPMRALQSGASQGLDSLNKQHAGSSGTQAALLGGAASALQGLMGGMTGALGTAADDYYRNTGSMYRDGVGQLSGLAGQIGAGYRSGTDGLRTGMSDAMGGISRFYGSGVQPLIGQMDNSFERGMSRRQAAMDELQRMGKRRPSEDRIRSMDNQLSYWRT